MTNEAIKVRDAREIQAAHDRLVAIILNEVPNPFGEAALESVKCAADVLCWVLEHDHNQSFSGVLASIDNYMRERGLVVHDSGKLRRRGA
jgi:hypothetical protein